MDRVSGGGVNRWEGLPRVGVGDTGLSERHGNRGGIGNQPRQKLQPIVEGQKGSLKN